MADSSVAATSASAPHISGLLPPALLERVRASVNGTSDSNTGRTAEQLTGANPSAEAILNYATAAYIIAQSGATLSEEQTQQFQALREAALAGVLDGQHFENKAQASFAQLEAAQKLDRLSQQMQAVAKFDPQSFSAAYASAAQSLGFDADSAAIAEAEKQAEAERKRRKEMLATPEEGKEAGEGYNVNFTPPPEKPAGNIDTAITKIDSAIDTLFRDAAAAGHITYNPQQAALVSLLCKHEMMCYRDRWLLDSANGRDPSYLTTDVVYGTIGAATGTFNSIAAALKGAYNGAQKLPDVTFGDWSAENLGQMLKNTGETIKIGGQEFARESVEQFHEQMNMISRKGAARILANTLEAGTKGNRYHTMKQGEWELHTDLVDDLEAIIGKDGVASLKKEDGRILIADVIDRFNNDSQRMMSAVTASHYKGSNHHLKQVPIARNSLNENTLAGLLYNGNYPINDGTKVRWMADGRLIDSYGTARSYEPRAVDSPDAPPPRRNAPEPAGDRRRT